MRNEIVAFAQRQATMAARRAAVPAVSAFVGVILFIFAVAGLFAALFFWLEPVYGPIEAALIVTAVAIVLGLVALLPLAVKRRPPPPPPDPTLDQFVSLVARSTPGLAPRHLILTAFLAALALGLSGRRPADKRK
jgi:hypothetical protein